MKAHSFAPLALMLLVSACVPAGPTSVPPRRNVDIITTEEVDRTSAATALEIIQRVRPSWLRTRGSASILLAAPIRVYVDGAPFGGVDALRQLSANAVERMERLGSSEATRRFGTDHANGAVIVYTR